MTLMHMQDIPLDQLQCLWFMGKQLNEDSWTLEKCNVQRGSMFPLVFRGHNANTKLVYLQFDLPCGDGDDDDDDDDDDDHYDYDHDDYDHNYDDDYDDDPSDDCALWRHFNTGLFY